MRVFTAAPPAQAGGTRRGTCWHCRCCAVAYASCVRPVRADRRARRVRRTCGQDRVTIFRRRERCAGPRKPAAREHARRCPHRGSHLRRHGHTDIPQRRRSNDQRALCVPGFDTRRGLRHENDDRRPRDRGRRQRARSGKSRVRRRQGRRQDRVVARRRPAERLHDERREHPAEGSDPGRALVHRAPRPHRRRLRDGVSDRGRAALRRQRRHPCGVRAYGLHARGRRAEVGIRHPRDARRGHGDPAGRLAVAQDREPARRGSSERDGRSRSERARGR